MKKNSSNDLLSAYFDGELSSQNRAEVERLLQASSEARRELDEIGALSQLLRSLPSDAAPDELAPSVLQRAERDSLLPAAQSETPVSGRTRAWAIVVGGLVATTAATFLVMSQINTGLPEVDFAPLKTSALEAPAEQGAVKTSAADARPNSEVADVGAPAQTPARVLEPNNLRNAKIGERFFETSSDRVAIVEVTVVDVKKAFGEFQVLLMKNSIPQIVTKKDLLADAGNRPRTKHQAQSQFGVYFESTESQLASILVQIRKNDLFADSKLQPAVDLSQVQLASVDLSVQSIRGLKRSNGPETLADTVKLGKDWGERKKGLKPPKSDDLEKQPAVTLKEQAAANRGKRSFQLPVNVVAKSLKMQMKFSPRKLGGVAHEEVEFQADSKSPSPAKSNKSAEESPASVRVIFVFQEKPPNPPPD